MARGGTGIARGCIIKKRKIMLIIKKMKKISKNQLKDKNNMKDSSNPKPAH